MTEPTFDQRVRETSFAGAVGTRLDALDEKVGDIGKDVKHIRQQTDRWVGALAVIGAAVSAVVSFAVALFR